jgi:integrase
VFQANAAAIGELGAPPYDLRHSFVSLLIQEGRTVIEVAGQAGHSAEACLRYYAHLFAEFDPAVRVSPEEEIRRARADVA